MALVVQNKVPHLPQNNSREILELSDKDLKLAANAGAILITRFRTKELGKVKAPDFIVAMKPKVVEKFGA